MRTEALRELADKLRRESRTTKVVKSAQVLEATAGLERLRRFLLR